jgi:hypothetical protein
MADSFPFLVFSFQQKVPGWECSHLAFSSPWECRRWTQDLGYFRR